MIYISSDHAGYNLKDFLVKKFQATDLGPESTAVCDYPDFALKLGQTLKK